MLTRPVGTQQEPSVTDAVGLSSHIPNEIT